jgi:hypothetical protein
MVYFVHFFTDFVSSWLREIDLEVSYWSEDSETQN